MKPEDLSPNQFQNMYDRLKSDGGFSMDLAGNEPRVGYMVSLPGSEQQIRSTKVAPAHIEEFARKNAHLLKGPGGKGKFLGGWDGGKETSLDVSNNIKPKSKVAKQYGKKVADADARTSAMDLSIARNQESAWDVKRNKEVPNKAFNPRGRRGNV